MKKLCRVLWPRPREISMLNATPQDNYCRQSLR